MQSEQDRANPPPKERETFAVDPARLAWRGAGREICEGDIHASYSADVIAMGGRLWVCTSISGSSLMGLFSPECAGAANHRPLSAGSSPHRHDHIGGEAQLPIPRDVAPRQIMDEGRREGREAVTGIRETVPDSGLARCARRRDGGPP
jgi:hypothetical protein